ncbi:hypothetical protein ACLMAJ_16940 [Nocardia sp. KC 131]|uniref:hypothetical protein n=1 Tax=Nocardia arseniciresistens TaxID=3392119 RepID=UPI00398E8EBA
MITNINTRRLLTCTAIVGAIITAGAGMSSAVPGDHSYGGAGRGGSYSQGDSAGAHKIDPMGYHHYENNPQRRLEQEQNLRDYHQNQNQNQNPRSYQPQGGGRQICKAQASWCR